MRYNFSDAFNTEYAHKLFHINPITGEICVSHDIDRDAGLVNFDLLVKAEDQVSVFLFNVDRLYYYYYFKLTLIK